MKVAKAGEAYTVIGYKGKQVRDQIHSADVVAAFLEFAANPRCGEVYNLGGGRANSASVLECLERLGDLLGRKVAWAYQEQARVGDHICYITNMAKFRRDFPNWRMEWSLERILRRMTLGEG